MALSGVLPLVLSVFLRQAVGMVEGTVADRTVINVRDSMDGYGDQEAIMVADDFLPLFRRPVETGMALEPFLKVRITQPSHVYHPLWRLTFIFSTLAYTGTSRIIHQ